MSLHMRAFFIVILLLLPCQVIAAWTTSPDFSSLDTYVPDAMQKWRVPGLALGIVHKDRTMYLKGFGVRDMDAPATAPENLVDAHTVFAAGSTTKAFTALAVAMLAHEGRLDLNAPVQDVLPEFGVAEPWVATHITPIDMLSHRIGVLEHDMLWLWNEGVPDKDGILERLRHFPVEDSFRSSFNYNNYFYLAAGKLIEHSSGQTWSEYVRDHFLTPLDMQDASLSVAALAEVENLAKPHYLEYDGALRHIPFRHMENIAPAGALNVSAADMVKWIRFQLGCVDAPQVAPQEVVLQTRLPQVGMPVPEAPLRRSFPGAHFLSYGMGWFLHDYHGVQLVEHGGNIDGFTALVALAPELELGMVVLCNLDATNIREALMYHVLDMVLGIEQQDWDAHFLKNWREQRDILQEEIRKRTADRVPDTKPSLALDAYTGRYENDIFGELIVRRANDGLEFEVLGKSAPLTHWHYDVFQRPFYTLDSPGIELMAFSMDSDGKIVGLRDDVMGEFLLID